MSNNLRINEIINEINQIDKKIFISSYNRNEQLSKLYSQLGNLYKVDKDFLKASDAYLKSAEYYKNIEDMFNHNENLYQSGKMLLKVDSKKSIEILNKAINLYIESNNLLKAANIKIEISKIYETLNDYNNTIDALKSSAEYYEISNLTSKLINCKLKISNLSILHDDFKQAIEMLNDIIKLSEDNNLLKFSINKYLFIKFLCVLSLQDFVEAKRLLDDYKNNYPSFTSTREYKLLNSILKTIEDYDVDTFTSLVSDYNNISIGLLDNIHIHLLLKIKNNIESSDQLV